MIHWANLISLVLGYLFGNIETGYIVAKINKTDILHEGSGNPGTTNALRTMGAKPALVTLLGDVLKAAIPILLVRFVIFPGRTNTLLLTMIAALGVSLGHDFPFWLRFRGGKGVAVLAGIYICMYPVLIPFGLAAFFIILFATNYVSVGSIVLAVWFPIWTAIAMRGENYYGLMVAIAVVIGGLVVFSHRANIKRLLDGNENKTYLFKKKETK